MSFDLPNIFFILVFVKSSFLFAEDKIQTVPLINLEELLPTFEEEKDELEKIEEEESLESENKNILNSSLVIFKGCAHNVHLEKVDEFNNKIHEFFNR